MGRSVCSRGMGVTTMYGTDAGVGTTALAVTGISLATGAWLLAGVGLVLGGIAFYLLFRKESKVKP